ncbi:hypothetical protein Golax_022703 [Gossypium laxum]|uniref:Uncharacterized protein n=1 Tax=Gossypium laxum TaxID=34288 RepID=A0A7J9B2L6_9ROSI|nr:hypothetical protein [Gossypium laxum]
MKPLYALLSMILAIIIICLPEVTLMKKDIISISTLVRRLRSIIL